MKIPKIVVAPLWGFRAPYYIVAAGAGVNVHLPHVVNVLGGSPMMWKNGFATIDFEVGYLPGPDAWMFAFGNTFPFWF